MRKMLHMQRAGIGKDVYSGEEERFADSLSVVKLPFPLTPQFKSMLQAGVGTRDLDVRWVSSISWYFLTLFGLQPVYNFILGSSNGKSAFFPPFNSQFHEKAETSVVTSIPFPNPIHE